MAIDTAEVTELKRQLTIARYDCHYLQRRLDEIRDAKDRLVHLLDTPTVPEIIAARGVDGLLEQEAEDATK